MNPAVPMPSRPAALERDVARSTPRRQTATKARVLLAEDDARVRRLIARSLGNHGFVVIEAENGVLALEAAAKEPPDLAIIDLRMPRMDGFEVVRSLKTTHATALPVLVLSGLDEPEDRIRAFDVGADDFISKPVYIPELLRRIEAFERTRRAYLEVRRANEEADRLRLFAAEAAALLAHDLNNGLSIAIANLQFVEEASRPDGEVGEAMLSTSRALRRMAGLVRNFVDISRLEDAAITPEYIPVEVGELFTLVAGVHESSAAQQGVRLDIQCPPGLIAMLDPVLVERVIHNLLGNAVRYVGDRGAIRLRARVQPQPSGEGGLLLLDVSNTGEPIPVDKRAALFEKYGTAGDRKAKRGMGLYFCRMACEAHSGSIDLETDHEFATVFVVRLPMPEDA
jgi:DNA-binding response OmpR family regulator